MTQGNSRLVPAAAQLADVLHERHAQRRPLSPIELRYLLALLDHLEGLLWEHVVEIKAELQ